MRRTRWLILAAICFIAVTVGIAYFAGVERARRESPPPPKPLRDGIEGTAEGWHYSHSEGGCPVFEARAKRFEQVAEPVTFQLQDVALQLFRDCGKTADQVKSAKAQFDVDSGVMFSDGEVEITTGVPASEGAPAGRLVKIVSSGVRFETKTGKASTDREAHFSFDQGEGKSVGADYDPTTRELHLKSQVELLWRGRDPKAQPMRVQTQNAMYYERGGNILLSPWAKLDKGPLHMESADKTNVTLKEGVIRLVIAEKATGARDEPERKLEYGADSLIMNMDEHGEVTQIEARHNARLVSTTKDARTQVNSESAVLAFTPHEHDSELTDALADGHAVVESKPVLKPGAQAPDTRVLRSDKVALKMRPGGKELNSIETETPGTLEFIPNRPGQPHRTVNGDHMWIAYGPNNALQSFRTTNARTRTETPPGKPGEKRPPVITSSKELVASFDPKTQQMTTLQQTSDFSYEEGERRARAEKATLDQTSDLMTLTGSARVTDPSGVTSGDRIVMDRKAGVTVAEGHVNSTRIPDKKDQSGSPAMLSGDEPMQARARKMTSSDQNRKIRYEGSAVAWQGANRVEADRIDFDRDADSMTATGSVVSQFVDKAQKDKEGTPVPKEKQSPVFTVVRAPSMVYTDDNRVAHYTGGAMLNRPNLVVKAREIKAFLKDSDSDSSLDKAFADGEVTIDQSTPARKRIGASEHAEYYAADQKIIMTGGQPQFEDSLKGNTHGRELTYFADNDRLLVNGVESQRAESVIRRKK